MPTIFTPLHPTPAGQATSVPRPASGPAGRGRDGGGRQGERRRRRIGVGVIGAGVACPVHGPIIRRPAVPVIQTIRGPV